MALGRPNGKESPRGSGSGEDLRRRKEKRGKERERRSGEGDRPVGPVGQRERRSARGSVADREEIRVQREKIRADLLLGRLRRFPNKNDFFLFIKTEKENLIWEIK